MDINLLAIKSQYEQKSSVFGFYAMPHALFPHPATQKARALGALRLRSVPLEERCA
jgi:hypothetical protein